MRQKEIELLEKAAILAAEDVISADRHLGLDQNSHGRRMSLAYTKGRYEMVCELCDQLGLLEVARAARAQVTDRTPWA